MTLVLTGKDIGLEGSRLKIEDIHRFQVSTNTTNKRVDVKPIQNLFDENGLRKHPDVCHKSGLQTKTGRHSALLFGWSHFNTQRAAFWYQTIATPKHHMAAALSTKTAMMIKSSFNGKLSSYLKDYKLHPTRTKHSNSWTCGSHKGLVAWKFLQLSISNGWTVFFVTIFEKHQVLPTFCKLSCQLISSPAWRNRFKMGPRWLVG